jgi:hypothetical protein
LVKVLIDEFLVRVPWGNRMGLFVWIILEDISGHNRMGMRVFLSMANEEEEFNVSLILVVYFAG